MKKTYIKSILAGSAALLAVSCSKDFLDESPTRYVTVADVTELSGIHPALADGTVRGIYEMMFTTGLGGTTRHEDFGQKGYDIYSDMLSGDMALTVNNYSRYSNFAQLITTTDFTYLQANYTAWRYYYRLINAANLVIQGLGGNNAVLTDAKNKASMGQAKALRAHSYFNLAQLYMTEYSETSKVLPIYTEPNGNAKPQSTTKEVYEFMIKDLEEALVLLNGFTRSDKYQINQEVAKGILAYVYAARGTAADNAKAKQLADEVVAGGTPITTKEQVLGGFNDIAKNPSWLWGVDITLDNGLDLVSWWGQMDYYTYSYQFAGDKKAIDVGLFNAIRANDVRKKQFFTGSGSNNLIPFNKFYAPERRAGGQRNITTDYIYMRVDEMVLLSAELAARMGQDAEAKTQLKKVLSQRFDNAADYAYVDALNGAALQSEIHLQTRIELWGEGKSLWAQRRHKSPVVRGANHLFLAGQTIPYNDDKLDFEIPQAEVQNNPFIN